MMDDDLDQREQASLAPYAFHSSQSRGRVYSEPAHPYRSVFQRDRDRILHSAPFRRLSGKMQVFTGDLGDYHRTRLTHTMEVASIARTIGRVLRLNEDLIESLALLHDLGHPPFGHAGEDALNEYLAGEGGFSHNAFALTLVEILEHRYPHFPGLNLSIEVLEGQRSRVDKRGSHPAPLLEVQVVDAADSIAYNAHDVDDAIKLGWVRVEDLADVPLAGDAVHHAMEHGGQLSRRMLRQVIVHNLIDRQVTSTLQVTKTFLDQSQWCQPDDARTADFRIRPDPETARRARGLQAFLYREVYRHERLLKVRHLAQRKLMELVEYLTRSPAKLPQSYQLRADQVGLKRSAVEYVAGMTDRYCSQQHEAFGLQ